MSVEMSWIIPLYNDALSVDWIVAISLEFLHSLKCPFEIILVNDGSQDDTLAKAQAWSLKTPQVQVLNHPRNLGYGRALRSGFQAAKATRWVGYTDGDAQYTPLDLVPHWGPFSELKNTALLGYKIRRADGPYRKLQSRIFSTLVRSLFRLRVKDLNCSLKVFPAMQLHKLYLQSDSAFIDSEILLKLRNLEVEFLEVPVQHFRRGHFSRAAETAGHGARLKTVISTLMEIWKFKAHANFTYQL